MEKSKTKTIILVVIVFSVAASAFAGIFFYNITNRIRTDQKRFASLDWAVQLNQYDRIAAVDTDKELYTAYKGEADFLIDGNGRQVARSSDDIKNSHVLTVFTKGDKEGYKYLDGKVAIETEFDEAYDFDGGYAIVSKEGSDYFVIDTKGRTVFQPEKKTSELEQIYGKYFLFYKDYHRSVINVETGEIIENVNFYDTFHDVGEGMFAAKADFSWDDVDPMYLLDKNFRSMHDGQLYGQIGCFGQGLCYVQKLVGATEEENEDYQVENGYMNKDGEVVLATDKAILGCKFAEDRALVYEKKQIHCIDQGGKVYFSLKLAEAFDRNPYVNFEYNYAQCYFRNGKAIVYDGEFYGVIDKSGNWVIAPVFDEMTYAGTDKLLVEYKGLHGMIRVK